MKRFVMTGFAVCTALFFLTFPGCDAELDPSDSGDSALSKPRGELTITGIDSDVFITSVQVYEGSVYSEDLPLIARGGSVSGNSPTITLSKPDGSVWDGTGSYLVLLNGSKTSNSDLIGYDRVIDFDKGRATESLSNFTPRIKAKTDDKK